MQRGSGLFLGLAMAVAAMAPAVFAAGVSAAQDAAVPQGAASDPGPTDGVETAQGAAPSANQGAQATKSTATEPKGLVEDAAQKKKKKKRKRKTRRPATPRGSH